MSAKSANAKQQQRGYDGHNDADISAGLGSSMRKTSPAKKKAASPKRKSATTARKKVVAKPVAATATTRKATAKKTVVSKKIVAKKAIVAKKKTTTKKAATASSQETTVARKVVRATKQVAKKAVSSTEKAKRVATKKKTITKKLRGIAAKAPAKRVVVKVVKKVPRKAPTASIAEKIAVRKKVSAKKKSVEQTPLEVVSTPKVVAEEITPQTEIVTPLPAVETPKPVKEPQPERIETPSKPKKVAAKAVEPAPVKEPVKPKVLRYARGEDRKAARKRLGTNGSAPHVSSPSPLAAVMPTPPQRMSVAAQQRALAEEAFSRIAPTLSAVATTETEEPAETPQHRGGPPAFHRSEFQIRFSEQDSLSTAIRLSKNLRDAKAAAIELVERFGRFPPDQAVLMRVLTMSDDRLLEMALDELLELDGRGKVRQSPELLSALNGIKSKNSNVSELMELLLEKLGAAGHP